MNSYILRFPLFLLLICFSFLQGCEEDEDVHPQLQTLAITDVSPSSATLNGKIINQGTFAVLDYGFVYGFSPDLNETTGSMVSLGQNPSTDQYSKIITGLRVADYYYDRTLYARAYLRNEKGVVFGQVASIKLPSPNVKSISPSSGKAGDRITITGDFFTSNTNEVEVTFGNITAKIIEVTPLKVVVEVPEGISTYYYSDQVQVELKMADLVYNVTSAFRIIPTFKDFAPTSGPIGTNIIISGDNLPNSYYHSTIRVYFGQDELSVSNYSTYGIQAVIPNHVNATKAAISVLIDGVKTVLPGEFTVTPHTVSSISPASGLAGSSFSIFGSDFPDNYYYNSYLSVKLGEVPASISYVSSGQVTVTVPHDLPEGSYKVTVTAGPYTVEAAQQYKVVSPSVKDFSPTSGGIGKEVIINGTFLPDQYYNVYFGSILTNTYSSSSTSLHVQVPPGVDAGKVKISVEHGNKILVADGEFTVLAPSIVTFSPRSSVAGSEVTITGSGFTPNIWTVVKFGTVETSVLSVTESTIRAVVPSGVSGAMKISVIHNGQTIISKDNFTVIK